MTRRDALKALALLPVVPELGAEPALVAGAVRKGMTATCAVEMARVSWSIWFDEQLIEQGHGLLPVWHVAPDDPLAFLAQTPVRDLLRETAHA